jgi:anti-sigma regulatory factor (Ser/Thr protein kinase)
VKNDNLLSKSWTSCPHELADIRRNVKAVCSELYFSEKQTNEIVLAIDEACTNIIRYAYNDCRDGTIRLEIVKDQQQVIFRLHDHAKPVSKDCLEKTNNDPLKPGGLGVMLMQRVMNSVKFVHTSECNGNILELKKDLPKENQGNEL